MPKRTPAEDRFWPKVEKTETCWQWVGAIGGHTYGNFWDGRRHARAHRFAYELLVGPIPEGMHLDHLCRNRTCVNPDHLEPVEPEENTRRGVRRQMARYQNINQTHCKHGHPLSGDNLYVQPKTGHRHCRECIRRRGLASRAKRRAAQQAAL